MDQSSRCRLCGLKSLPLIWVYPLNSKICGQTAGIMSPEICLIISLVGYTLSVFLSVLHFLILSGRQTSSVGAFEGHGCVRMYVDTSTVVCLVCFTRTGCVCGSLSESSSRVGKGINQAFSPTLMDLMIGFLGSVN